MLLGNSLSSISSIMPLTHSHTIKLKIFITISVSELNHQIGDSEKMDPNPTNFPILSYVMSKLPSLSPRRSAATAADEFDIEQPPLSRSSSQSRSSMSVSPKVKEEPYFELSEQMPHLDDPKVVAAMRSAVAEVSQARAALRNLGKRPDHEEVDKAKAKLAEVEIELSSDLEEISLSPRSADSEGRKDDQSHKVVLEEKDKYKAVISLEQMHTEYEKMLEEAERKLEKIYEAAVAGLNMAAIEESMSGKRAADEVEGEEEVKEEIVAVMKQASQKEIERVDLSEKKLRMLPEAFFAILRSLVALNLSNNQLEVIPDSIAGLEKLQELNLSSNILQSLPDSIGLLLNLKILDVSKNKLTALPDSICRCRSLEELDVSFNKLAYVPTNIGYELMNLRRLFINLNKIRSLPTSVGKMKSLRLLDAHFNELRGLPVSIGKLTNLEILDVSSNFSDLSELPYTIGDLTNLKELDVSNNQIRELPDSLGRLDNLIKLNVDQNPLVIPPKQIVDEGVQTVKAYMVKRRLDMLLEQDRISKLEEESEADSILTRSTSWLGGFVTSVSGYLVGEGSSKTDPYLNQQF